MQVRLPLPSSWPEIDRHRDGGRVYEVYPAVTLTVGPLVPLPKDLTAWGDAHVLVGLTAKTYRVRNVEDLETANGWPVTMFSSDALNPATGDLFERRLHALFRFVRHGAAVVLRARSVEAFEAIEPEVRAVLARAEPDWRNSSWLTLNELWRGIDLQREEPALARVEAPKELDQIK